MSIKQALIITQKLTTDRNKDFVVLRVDKLGGYQTTRDSLQAAIEATAEVDNDIAGGIRPQIIDIEVANNVHGTFVVNHEFELPLHDPGAQNTVVIHLTAPKHYFTASHPNNQFTLETLVAGNAHRLVKDHMELSFGDHSMHVMQYIVIAEPSID